MNSQPTTIVNFQVAPATEYNEKTIILTLDQQPTVAEQDELFAINVNAVVLEF